MLNKLQYYISKLIINYNICYYLRTSAETKDVKKIIFRKNIVELNIFK